MKRGQNNALIQQYNRINSMKSIQNNQLLTQVNRRNNIPQKISEPNKIREAILDQRKPDQKMDNLKFNRIYSTIEGTRKMDKEKLWASRTNQPYKTIFPAEYIKKEYKNEQELVVYKVKKEDKDENVFRGDVKKLKEKIDSHNHELKNTFATVRKQEYAEQFEYNNKLKYNKIKYDPESFDDMKNDITDFYKKEQEEQEKNKKRTDDIIESMVGINIIDNSTQSNDEQKTDIQNTCGEQQNNNKIQNINIQTEKLEQKNEKNINKIPKENKYLQRQKKI